jgi:hypothetical protein
MRAFAGFAGLLIAAMCALAPAPASAQGTLAGRDSVYVVSGVRVEATAASSAEARTQAFAAGQRLGFERLVRRLTLPDDVQRLGAPRPDQAAIEGMVSSVEVEDERRSGTRYVGRLAVRFQPSAVQAFLRAAGFAVVDARAPPVLVVPLWTSVTVEAADAWRLAWEQGGYGEELVPLAIASRSLIGAPDWMQAQPFAQSVGAASALYLDLRVAGPIASAYLVEIAPNRVPRDRGQVQARIGPGPEGLGAAMQSLAEQASERLQSEWKARLATSSGQRARVAASALFDTQGEWQRIKSGLEQAASALISEIRIEAVARQGALVSFSFVGNREQLAAELRRYGVSVEETQQGPVLRAAN